jgi:hypothetical protein
MASIYAHSYIHAHTYIDAYIHAHTSLGQNSELMSMTKDGKQGKLWQDLKNTDGKDLPLVLCTYLKHFKVI